MIILPCNFKGRPQGQHRNTFQLLPLYPCYWHIRWIVVFVLNGFARLDNN